MKYVYFLFLGLILFQCTGKKSDKENVKQREEVKQIEIKASDVQFNDQEDGTWTMTGYIKNVNDFEISGKAEVVLLNKNKSVISRFTTGLNEGDPILPGDSVQFSHVADQATFAGATSYKIQVVNEP